MFLPLQVLFFLAIGVTLIVRGVLRLAKAKKRWPALLMIALGLCALAWWPFVFFEEQSRTRTDSEGTYILPRR